MQSERSVNCSDDPDMMFDAWREREARMACATCWFAPQCVDLGEGEEYGVWAGEAKEAPSESTRMSEEDTAKRDAQILARSQRGVSSRLIAEAFSMNRKTVERIVRRETAAEAA